eukprot:2458470-Rhodomonas_salina.1
MLLDTAKAKTKDVVLDTRGKRTRRRRMILMMMMRRRRHLDVVVSVDEREHCLAVVLFDRRVVVDEEDRDLRAVAQWNVTRGTQDQTCAITRKQVMPEEDCRTSCGRISLGDEVVRYSGSAAICCDLEAHAWMQRPE